MKSSMLKFISCGGVGSLDLDRRPWLDRPWSEELRDERLGPLISTNRSRVGRPPPRSIRTPSPQPGLLVGLIRARARCSPRGTSFGHSVQPRPPNSGGDGGPTYLHGGGFLPSRKCLGAPSPPTPLNGYTFTLVRRHPRRHHSVRQ